MDSKPVVIYRGSLRQAVGSPDRWEEVRQTLQNYLDTGFAVVSIAETKSEIHGICVCAYLRHQNAG